MSNIEGDEHVIPKFVASLRRLTLRHDRRHDSKHDQLSAYASLPKQVPPIAIDLHWACLTVLAM